MLWEREYAGGGRLLIAAGISAALHAAIVLSVGREAGINGPLSSSPAATFLTARISPSSTESEFTRELTAEARANTSAEPVQPSSTAQPAAPVSGETTVPGAVYYFKASELERRPFPITGIEVPPPESADAVTGSVMIRLRISESGRVDDARIMMGTGIAEFEASALREFSRAQFHPGYRGNLPVRSEMLIEVTLRPPAGGKGLLKTVD